MVVFITLHSQRVEFLEMINHAWKRRITTHLINTIKPIDF